MLCYLWCAIYAIYAMLFSPYYLCCAIYMHVTLLPRLCARHLWTMRALQHSTYAIKGLCYQYKVIASIIKHSHPVQLELRGGSCCGGFACSTVIFDREHSRATCVGSVAGRPAACSVALLREAEVICAWDLLGTRS